MCLSNSKKIEVHNEPIKAYKILIEMFPPTDDETYTEGELISPYYHDFKWNIGEMMTAEGEIKVIEIFGVNWGHDVIEGGAFHAFKDLSEAERYFRFWAKGTWTARSLPGCPTCRYALAEVEIPQGAKAYEGDYYLGCEWYIKSYAANKMKVVRIIETR